MSVSETLAEQARVEGSEPTSREQLERLTKREKQVLYWVVEGKTNGDIGKILEISPRTVEKHCESIFRKLGIENRYAAIVFALTSNWTLELSD